MEIYTDNSRVIDGLVLRNKKLEERIAELEAKNKELNDIYFSCNCRPSELAIRDLEQQAKGIEDAVTKLERPDVAFAPCLILNDDLLDFSGELRNQAKALKEGCND